MFYFLPLNLSSLKQKSTKMAKRQSFMMEAKHIATRKPTKELSNLHGKFNNVYD